jgi:site-specific DNA-methyltransferase (adenine-specific)
MIELNRIYNEDCLEGMRRISDKTVDLIITDPPYLHVKGGMKSKKFNVGKMKENSFINTQMNDFSEKEIYSFLKESIRLFKKSFNGYFFCSKLQVPYYLNFALNNKLKFDLLVWDRCKNAMVSCKFFASNIDYIVRIYGNGQSLNNVGEIENKIKYYQKIKKYKQGEETNHPTEKPVKLIEEFILLSSQPNQVVLDPYTGSGTTAIACINTNRNYIGFELDKHYCDVANERVQKAIQDKATSEKGL